MISDLLTKPLQGSQFKKFRDAILNVQEDASRTHNIGVSMMHRSVLRKEQKEPCGQRVSWKWPVCDKVLRYGKGVRALQQKSSQLQKSRTEVSTGRLRIAQMRLD